MHERDPGSKGSGEMSSSGSKLMTDKQLLYLTKKMSRKAGDKFN